MTCASVGEARRALRAATDGIHRRLHALPAFVAIVHGTIDVDGYRALLARLYGFHASLDATLRAGADGLATYGITPASRADALADDLEALGMPRVGTTRLPLMRPSAAGASTAALFGHLYVRDGATLGGRIVARHLARLLGPGAPGCSFFAGDALIDDAWHATCRAIEHVAEGEPDGLAELVCGAQACFMEFERWMT